MIPALTCLLLPFAGGCSGYVREVASIASVVRNQARYAGAVLSVTGRVSRFDEWRSRTGLAQEVFFVCENGCIRVYMREHSPIRDGELVTVRGQYYQAFHAGRDTYYNEIEGSEVLPRD